MRWDGAPFLAIGAPLRVNPVYATLAMNGGGGISLAATSLFRGGHSIERGGTLFGLRGVDTPKPGLDNNCCQWSNHAHGYRRPRSHRGSRHRRGGARSDPRPAPVGAGHARLGGVPREPRGARPPEGELPPSRARGARAGPS